MEVSPQQKIQIVRNRITGLKQEEFDLLIQKDVYKECGMDDRLEKTAEQLTNNRKMQKAYEDKLDEITEPEESEV